MASKFYLPSKITSYLRRLQIEYSRAGNLLLSEVIQRAKVAIKEETEYDNWNGGTYGHDVLLFLPAEIFAKVSLQEQSDITSRLREDLNTCARSIANEFFSAVHLEFIDEADPIYQRAISVSQKIAPNPDALAIWKPGYIRLFISHRDQFKSEAKCLSDALDDYGISGFVAHDTIQPMTMWQVEILKALETMEIMLTFITDDFHGSTWTNQEIGYALGKDIPVISLKLQKEDPQGFIGANQAVRAHLDELESAAPVIFDLIANRLGQKARAREILISAFLSSRNFNETRDRFDRMSRVVDFLSDEEVNRIVEAYRENDQLYNAIYLTNHNQRLKTFLKRCTEKDFLIRGKSIEVAVEDNDEIPF